MPALLVLDSLLMVFSVVMWVLGNDALAGVAGMGAIALTADIARRLLVGRPSGDPPDDSGDAAKRAA
jgi:hypothetical protein